MKGQRAILLTGIIITGVYCGCNHPENTEKNDMQTDTTKQVSEADTFKYFSEQFADLKILRYRIPGFNELSLNEKKMLYYLYEAALSGWDIHWDQNYKHNLCIRKTLETILNTFHGDKNTDEYKKFLVYAKRVFFSSGIHHHYSNNKIMPDFSRSYFAELLNNSDASGLPLAQGETIQDLIVKLTPILFDPDIDAKKVNKDSSVDIVQHSAVNFYEGVTQKEVEAYYKSIASPNDSTPVSYGLNSKVIKENGKVTEKVWKLGGMYSAAIEKIVYWLEKAKELAQTPEQEKSLGYLIEFYKTGDLSIFDKYCIAWVGDTTADIDVVNGFIEVYNDPRGQKGSFESVVSVRDPEASKRIVAIGAQAQWFEDHSPIADAFKKKNVKGISAKVINVVMESGDASPSTPIGINLPNSNWIRSKVGSKSVNLGNIVTAYNESSKSSGLLEEFAYSQEEIDRAKADAGYSDKLHTDMHEVIGHASGKINPGVGTPSETLKNYANTLEEARADLVALYYLMDEKLIDIGVMKTLETGKAAYDDYIRNGLIVQLVRVKPGEQLEEAHMRNRQAVAKWVYEKGKKDNVIEKKIKNGKTYFVINDYQKLRKLFGELLAEIQRIKSEGDFEAGRKLIETYGVQVDQELLKEVLSRYEKLHIAPYSGFINPKLIPVKKNGEIIDVKVEYPTSFLKQMLEYAKNYSFLPVYN